MSDSKRGERNQDLGQGLAILASVILCCAIVSVVTFAAVSYSTDRDERAEYYQAEAQRNAEAICVGREGGLLAECIEEHRRASRDAYTAEQDLNAQRQMALWALWMFIVSSLTAGLTLWALWYVRGTLQATREALDDTGNATKAMVRQNELTEAAQRPWISIEAHVTELELAPVGTLIFLEANVKNIGKMVAERCAVRVALIEDDSSTAGQNRIELTRSEATKAARGELPDGRSPYPMLPEQAFKFGTKKETIGEPHWLELDAYPDKRLLYTFFVSARYFIPGDDKIRETDRAFCLTYVPPDKNRDDAFLPFGIPHPLPEDLTVDRVWMRPAGHNRTS